MDALLHDIAERRDECVDLCRTMVRMPTLNPPGLHYREICDWAAARYRTLGWDVEAIRAVGAPGDGDAHPRWNVVARHEAGPGPVLHLNGHHDVVAAGEGWTRDPFGGDVSAGRVWGRGACDMKGGIASAMVAAEALARRMTRGAVEVSLTADEESGGYGGVAHLAHLGRFERVDHVIIPEPLDPGRICLGHRGVWWAEIETRGRIAHGSMPFLGDCAVRHMGAVLAEMEATLFPLLEGRTTDAPVVPDGARHATLNLNAVHGGEPAQAAGYDGLPSACVPDRCVLTIDRRVLPEEDFAAVRREVAEVMERVAARREGFTWEIRDLFEVRPSLAPRDAPVVRAVERAVAEVLGRAATHVLSPGTYDQKHVDRIGRLRDCIAYGPGRLELAHQPDEWVGIDDMAEAAQVIGLAGWRLLHEA